MRSRIGRRAPRLVVGAALAAVAVPAAGCSDDPSTPDLPFSAGDPPQTFTAAAGASAPPAPTGGSAAPAVVPQSCDDVASVTRVVEVLGAPLEGSGSFVYAGPLPEAGRTARITCGYGVPEGEDPVPAVEITINGYVDAETARGRLDGSVESARSQGDATAAVELDGRPGFVLADAETVSYVVADGARTLVVSLRRGVVSRSAEQLVLLDLAALTLGLPLSGETSG
ncbi:MAG TPA: hypothetical protein VFR74_12655 [Jiangellales bacterium]|nr:hypothetical protein [Jiangellales bacterium]